jgi:hypothetical protein
VQLLHALVHAVVFAVVLRPAGSQTPPSLVAQFLAGSRWCSADQQRPPRESSHPSIRGSVMLTRLPCRQVAGLSLCSRQPPHAGGLPVLDGTASTPEHPPTPPQHTDRCSHLARPARGQQLPVASASASPPPHLNVTSELLASPSELSTSPSELLASPSKLSTSPSELLASPSELLASPSELSTSPSELLASPSKLSTSPSELLASPSELSASPSELLASPSEL